MLDSDFDLQSIPIESLWQCIVCVMTHWNWYFNGCKFHAFLRRLGSLGLTSSNPGNSIGAQPDRFVCQFQWAVIKGDLRTICRFSYMKVYKLITLGTKFKTLLSLGRKITMFSKFITNYIEQGWWHSSLTLKCMHLLLKEVNKRGRHAYNLHRWTCLPSGIVMEIHCHITGIFEAAVRLRLPTCCSV